MARTARERACARRVHRPQLECRDLETLLLVGVRIRGRVRVRGRVRGRVRVRVRVRVGVGVRVRVRVRATLTISKHSSACSAPADGCAPWPPRAAAG